MKFARVIFGGLLWLATTVAFGRGGGGCFEEGTPIQTPHGPVRIESLRVGDPVAGGVVQAVMRVEPTEYLEVTVGDRVVHVTAEHPFAIAPGIFRIASQLHVADPLLMEGEPPACADEAASERRRPGELRLGRSLALQITAIRRIPAERPAYNLLISPGGTFVAGGCLVHNKGCFLPETPILQADGSTLAISTVRPGQQLLAFDLTGNVVTTTVNNVITHDVDEYLVVKTAQVELHVTVEHPFYVGSGTFKTLVALKPGDEIFAVAGRASRLSTFNSPAAATGETPVPLSLTPQRILSIDRIRQPTRVYNLQTAAPNTYFANGIAVHNKGGGGCFPAGTHIATPDGPVAIETVQPGTVVLTGQGGTTVVDATFFTRARVLTLVTDAGTLRTTAEHPILCADGTFRPAGNLTPGNSLPGAQVVGGALGTEEPVYNLRVGPPHTFMADGFVVHNKGGGGGFGGGGFHSSGYHSGRSGGNADPTVFFIIVGAILIIIIARAVVQSQQKTEQNLDFCYSAGSVAAKAEKTQKLLEFIARTDEAFAPLTLGALVTGTFTKLQQCWQARAYAPMQPLLLPDLYRAHCQQLAGLQRNHEINLIDPLRVERVQIVNVRYPHAENQREFTALITATARDYYVDDRSQAFLRGDQTAAQFQEFWTFQRQNGKWQLREIEQTRESDKLKEENFFEPFTDKGVEQVYGAAAKGTGAAGPWLEKSVETKATRIERLLNFLVQTDKLWERTAMLERARQVFLQVMLAQEAGDVTAVSEADLFPSVVLDLRQAISRQRQAGTTIEFRNLCVRKVELILVRNFHDNSQDEFTVRISAHAQRISRGQDTVISQEDDVTPFEEYWTLGRQAGKWKVKEVLPPAKGAAAVQAENVDEDSNAGQLQWYYKQTRAN